MERKISNVEKLGYLMTMLLYLISPIILGVILDIALGYDNLGGIGLLIVFFVIGFTVIYNEAEKKGV